GRPFGEFEAVGNELPAFAVEEDLRERRILSVRQCGTANGDQYSEDQRTKHEAPAREAMMVDVRREGLLGFASRGCGSVFAPEPAERIGQDRAAVNTAMAAFAEFELVVVLGKLQCRGHLLIRERPVTVQIVEIG